MPEASPADLSAVIVAGGDAVDAMVLDRLPQRAYVVAADSGLDEAHRLGLSPDVVIGDMDSVSQAALEEAPQQGVEVVVHPVDKDATDLELALAHVHGRGHRHAVLVGGYGGRMSHLLGNALALTAPDFADMRIEWHVRSTTLVVVRPSQPLQLTGHNGDLVSLLATGGPAAGVVTQGLRWPLDHETLTPGSTRGISNEMTGEHAAVHLTSGTLLALHERTEP